MKSSYIFIEKENSMNFMEGSNNFDTNPVKTMLSSILEYDESENIIISKDFVEYKISVNEIKKANRSNFISFSCDESPSKSAFILDALRNIILKGNHRNDYDIIIANDEASNYYCNNLIKYYSSFERNLRQIVFYILVEAFGSKWYKEISPELEKELKKRVKKEKFIEEALYGFTNYQLEEFLFEPRRRVSSEETIDIIIKDKNYIDLSKEEIITHLNNSKLESLWNRIFKGKIHIEDIENRLAEIRKYRNIVAHNKLIEYDEFENSRRVIKKFNKEVEKSIIDFEMKEITLVDFKGIVEAFGVLVKSMNGVQDYVKPMARILGEFALQIKGIIPEVSNEFRSGLYDKGGGKSE